MSIVLLLQMMGDGIGRVGGGGAGWLICIRVWVGGTGSGYHLTVFFGAFVFCSLMFPVPVFRWLEEDGYCVCFFVFSPLPLSLVSLARSY